MDIQIPKHVSLGVPASSCSCGAFRPYGVPRNQQAFVDPTRAVPIPTATCLPGFPPKYKATEANVLTDRGCAGSALP